MCCLTLSALQNRRQPDLMGPEVPEPLRGRGFRAGLVRVLLMEARWGRLGSRGRPCLTPLICAPHALSDQETLNKPMFEMCLSKYLLSKSFRMQASIVGPRVEPTAGKGPSPPDTSGAHWEEGPHPGGTVGGLAPRGWDEGDPRGEAWEPDTAITRRGGGSPVPRRPRWGRSPFYPHPSPSLFPRITSLWMLPPPSQWALTFILKLSIYLCSHLEMSVH